MRPEDTEMASGEQEHAEMGNEEQQLLEKLYRKIEQMSIDLGNAIPYVGDNLEPDDLAAIRFAFGISEKERTVV